MIQVLWVGRRCRDTSVMGWTSSTCHKCYGSGKVTIIQMLSRVDNMAQMLSRVVNMVHTLRVEDCHHDKSVTCHESSI